MKLIALLLSFVLFFQAVSPAVAQTADVLDSAAFHAAASRRPVRPDNSARIESLIKQMTVEEKIGQMTQLTIDMVTTGKSNGDLGKLAVFAGVHKFPARVKCAILPWHAAVAAVEGKSEPVSTESEE